MGAEFKYQVFPATGLPIYRQLMEQVRRQVAAGRLEVGEFLPSVRQVALDLQVNPMTVSKAYSQLERDGVVELVRGQGMRVRAPNGTARGDGGSAADSSRSGGSSAGPSGGGGTSGGGGPVETLRQRRLRMMPVLHQVVATAYQLALTPQQVHDLLDPLLKELERDEVINSK